MGVGFSSGADDLRTLLEEGVHSQRIAGVPRVDPEQQGSARELHPGAQPASAGVGGKKTAIGQRRRARIPECEHPAAGEESSRGGARQGELA